MPAGKVSLGAAPGNSVTSAFTTNGSWAAVPPTSPQADPSAPESGGEPGEVPSGQLSTEFGYDFFFEFLLQFTADGKPGVQEASNFGLPVPGTLSRLGRQGS